MRKPVVYLSGPITGVKDYWKPFEEAEDRLTSVGFAVINPAKLPEGMDLEDYMAIALQGVIRCDVVYALGGSCNSKGAGVEIALAEYLGKPVYAAECLDLLGKHIEEIKEAFACLN